MRTATALVLVACVHLISGHRYFVPGYPVYNGVPMDEDNRIAKGRGINWPPIFGHKYLGPGNPMNNGHPVDEDDRIAWEHDMAYGNAKNDEDVRQADLQAIKDFGEDYLYNDNSHSLVGHIAILGKHLVESEIDETLYPEIPKNRLAVYQTLQKVRGGPR